MVLDAIQSKEAFGDAKEFLVSGNIIQYPFDEEDKKILYAINDPKEFAFKFMELGIRKWFLLTRGE